MIRRQRERAHELPVVQGILRLHTGQVRILDLLPEAEKLRHALQQRRRLGAEDHGQLTEPLLLVAVERDLVLDRRAVLIFEAALEDILVVCGAKNGTRSRAGATSCSISWKILSMRRSGVMTEV